MVNLAKSDLIVRVTTDVLLTQDIRIVGDLGMAGIDAGAFRVVKDALDLVNPQVKAGQHVAQ